MDVVLKQGFLGLAALLALGAALASAAGPDGVGLALGVAAYLALAAAVVARSPRVGSLVAAVGAFSANAYLFSHKWEAAKATQSLCNINTYIDCDRVNASEWSTAFGVPITLLGMGFYAGLAIASLVRDEEARRFHQLNLVFAIVNVLYSVFLAYISLVVVKALCVLCMSIYASNLLLLWAGIAGHRRQPGPWDPMELGASRDFVTIAVVFLVTVAGGGFAFKAQQSQSVAAQVKSGNVDDAMLATLYTEPCGTVELDGTEPTWGPPSARYAVVEWADYLCPHCAEASAHLKPFLAENKDVKLTFKVFPLTGECSDVLTRPGNHPERCTAAFAAECARPQGKYFEMSQLLFENQGYFAPSDVEFMATQVGLDVATWKACMADPSTEASVRQDSVAGQLAGVRGTPTMLLKGTHGDAWILIQGGPEALEAVIKAHRSGRPMPPPAACPPEPEH